MSTDRLPARPRSDSAAQFLRTPRLGLYLLLTSAAILVAGPVHGQDAAELQVHVAAADSRVPLARARVEIRRLGVEGWTAPDGSVTFVVPANALLTISISRVGYRSTTHIVPASRPSGRIVIALDPAPIALEPVQVIVEQSSPWLAEFDRRRTRQAGGTFFGPDEVEQMRLTRFSDLFRRVSGANVACRRGQCVVLMRGAQCPVQFFIDGTFVRGLSPDDIPPATVEAVEVYRGAATLPPELQRGTAMCGTVVVWTRDPNRGRDRR